MTRPAAWFARIVRTVQRPAAATARRSGARRQINIDIQKRSVEFPFRKKSDVQRRPPSPSLRKLGGSPSRAAFCKLPEGGILPPLSNRDRKSRFLHQQSCSRSYGYRPGRSALDAVGVTRKRCWDADWVIDLDIQAFFDSLPHDLVERAVAHHTDLPWVRLYIARWLRAPVQHPDGTREERTKGTPQGGVVSPLLANLFLHYAFDRWMQRTFPSLRFERYADDAIVHCRSEQQARVVVAAIRGRFVQCGLQLHPTKTRIVYCKDDDRPGQYEHVQFDFLGYTFQPRRAKNRWGKYFVSFLPAISTKAAKAIRNTIREWRMASTRNNQSLEDLARLTNPAVRGWMHYYGRYYRSKCVQVLRHLNEALAAWVRRKYTRLRRRERASMHWLGRLARRDPNLFALWQLGVRPLAEG